jgi:preprotein translocase subunit SecG
MQHGKGADAGAAFGAGSAGSVFGARGANSFLYKLTFNVAAGFFITSFYLAYLSTPEVSSENQQSVIENSIIPSPITTSDILFIDKESK